MKNCIRNFGLGISVVGITFGTIVFASPAMASAGPEKSFRRKATSAPFDENNWQRGA